MIETICIDKRLREEGEKSVTELLQHCERLVTEENLVYPLEVMEKTLSSVKDTYNQHEIWFCRLYELKYEQLNNGI